MNWKFSWALVGAADGCWPKANTFGGGFTVGWDGAALNDTGFTGVPKPTAGLVDEVVDAPPNVNPLEFVVDPPNANGEAPDNAPNVEPKVEEAFVAVPLVRDGNPELAAGGLNDGLFGCAAFVVVTPNVELVCEELGVIPNPELVFCVEFMPKAVVCTVEFGVGVPNDNVVCVVEGDPKGKLVWGVLFMGAPNTVLLCAEFAVEFDPKLKTGGAVVAVVVGTDPNTELLWLDGVDDPNEKGDGVVDAATCGVPNPTKLCVGFDIGELWAGIDPLNTLPKIFELLVATGVNANPLVAGLELPNPSVFVAGLVIDPPKTLPLLSVFWILVFEASKTLVEFWFCKEFVEGVENIFGVGCCVVAIAKLDTVGVVLLFPNPPNTGFDCVVLTALKTFPKGLDVLSAAGVVELTVPNTFPNIGLFWLGSEVFPEPKTKLGFATVWDALLMENTPLLSGVNILEELFTVEFPNIVLPADNEKPWLGFVPKTFDDTVFSGCVFGVAEENENTPVLGASDVVGFAGDVLLKEIIGEGFVCETDVTFVAVIVRGDIRFGELVCVIGKAIDVWPNEFVSVEGDELKTLFATEVELNEVIDFGEGELADEVLKLMVGFNTEVVTAVAGINEGLLNIWFCSILFKWNPLLKLLVVFKIGGDGEPKFNPPFSFIPVSSFIGRMTVSCVVALNCDCDISLTIDDGLLDVDSESEITFVTAIGSENETDFDNFSPGAETFSMPEDGFVTAILLKLVIFLIASVDSIFFGLSLFKNDLTCSWNFGKELLKSVTKNKLNLLKKQNKKKLKF